MKIHINGLHISAIVVAAVLYAFWLPAWPSLFIFVIGQCAAIYITYIVDVITEASE